MEAVLAATAAEIEAAEAKVERDEEFDAAEIVGGFRCRSFEVGACFDIGFLFLASMVTFDIFVAFLLFMFLWILFCIARFMGRLKAGFFTDK